MEGDVSFQSQEEVEDTSSRMEYRKSLLQAINSKAEIIFLCSSFLL